MNFLIYIILILNSKQVNDQDYVNTITKEQTIKLNETSNIKHESDTIQKTDFEIKEKNNENEDIAMTLHKQNKKSAHEGNKYRSINSGMIIFKNDYEASVHLRIKKDMLRNEIKMSLPPYLWGSLYTPEFDEVFCMIIEAEKTTNNNLDSKKNRETNMEENKTSNSTKKINQTPALEESLDNRVVDPQQEDLPYKYNAQEDTFFTTNTDKKSDEDLKENPESTLNGEIIDEPMQRPETQNLVVDESDLNDELIVTSEMDKENIEISYNIDRNDKNNSENNGGSNKQDINEDFKYHEWNGNSEKTEERCPYNPCEHIDGCYKDINKNKKKEKVDITNERDPIKRLKAYITELDELEEEEKCGGEEDIDELCNDTEMYRDIIGRTIRAFAKTGYIIAKLKRIRSEIPKSPFSDEFMAELEWINQ